MIFLIFLVPVIVLIMGIILSLYPPKKINGLTGYRTRRSMQSQEAWDFSQRFAGLMAVIVGILMLAIALILYFSTAKENWDPLNVSLFVIAQALTLPFPTIIPVEIALKKKFGK
jgi:uncharacterized membrane protein